MHVEDHRYEQALRDFVSSADDRVTEAFGKISQRAISMLHVYLKSRLPAPEDREDVIQEVLQRLWRSRATFELRGVASWWIFVKRTADRCAIDHFRSKGQALAQDPIDMADIPDEDIPSVDVLVEALEDRERLYRLADEVWLGEPGPHLERKVLAAKLFYLDGMRWDDICRMMAPYQEGGADLTRNELDRWLIDPIVIRHVAFDCLYLSNEVLAARLLGIPEADQRELDRLRDLAGSETTEVPPTGWTWPEVHAVIWRYRYAALFEQIVRMPNCRLKKEELVELFDRCRSQFPFDSIVGNLQSRIERSPSSSGLLGQARLWHRLVFEYFASDGLPQKDIHERTAPAASRVGYDLTLGMLNVWLSNGRLFKQLAAHLASQEGVHGHK